MSDVVEVEVVVIGSGPAGQKAAIQAAKLGHKVVVIEREPSVGGACVHYGTIPSKTLRETAVAFASMQRRCGAVAPPFDPTQRLAGLMSRLDAVIASHERFIEDQLRRNSIDIWRGRARLRSPHEVEVVGLDGSPRRLRASTILIATGSRPRAPADVPIDHEHILDSDSILSMTYLPTSLCVLGGGVIASEYASIFAALGVHVTMVDRAERPLAFVDPELTTRFVSAFEGAGGVFRAGRSARHVALDPDGGVITTLDNGELVRSEKLLCALGRVANVDGLDLEAAGLRANARGLIEVDAACRTAVPSIYAIGDVIGPPSLASSAMEQGRRAICHRFGVDVGVPPEWIPIGIYTIPEISTVGLDERQTIERHGGVLVGRASFAELARGQIAAIPDGLLKLVTGPDGRRLLGVQIIGEGAAELVHVGQVALLAGWDVDAFVDGIFNFPTLAEGYRVAALDIVKQRGERARVAA